MKPATSRTQRRPTRTAALALAALFVSMLPFAVAGVLAPKVAHAAPSVQTTFSMPELTNGLSPANGTSMVNGPGGDVWITDSTTEVEQLTPSGTFTAYPTSADPFAGNNCSGQNDIAVGPDGNLWITIQGTWLTPSSHIAGVIGRLTPSGTVTYFQVPSARDAYGYGGDCGPVPYGITAGPLGYMWFTEQAANNIGVTSTTGGMREFAVPTTSSGPTGIVEGPDGNLWFTEASADKIGRMTSSGTFTEFSVASGATPYGITVGPDGNLWFTERGRGAIGTMTTSGGGYAEYSTSSASSAPVQIKPGPDGAMWFTENNANTVGRITTSGGLTEYTVSANPFAITTGPDGNIWYSDYGLYHSPPVGSSTIDRLPMVDCGDVSNSVTSANNDTGVRDTPGSQESVQISVANCGVPTLTGATTSTAVTAPSGCPAAPSIPSFSSTLAYGQSTSQTFSFTDPSCLGTYTVTTTTAMGSTTVASSTTYYVVSNGHGSHIVGDFNGDGYQDVALADLDNGTVAVYYGGPNGLETRAPQTFTATSPGMPSQLAGFAAFGWSLAAGNYNGDGYSDLAIGAGGAVAVLFGGPPGLTAKGSQFIPAPSSMSSGFFGRDIISGDFNHDGYSDAVISAPLQNVGTIAEEGAVDIMYGSPTGLSGQTIYSENSPGIPGPAATRYDNFGWNMAAGDFNGDGNTDVAINEGENKNGVVVLYGSSSGLTVTGAQYLQEVGGSEYSAFLATGKFKGDGYDDLAIGEPYGSTSGLVEVHYGSAAGLGTVAYGTSQKITLNTRGMPAEPSSGGLFGAGLASGDIKHNAHADLIAVGAPGGGIVMWGTSTKLTAKGSRFVPGGGGVSITDVIGLGDFNGDGFADEIYCVPTFSVGFPPPACNVYNGTATGVSSQPSATFNQFTFQQSSLQGNHAGW